MSDMLGGQSGEQARLPAAIMYMRVVAMLLLIVALARACQILGIEFAGWPTFADLTPTQRAGAATLLIVYVLTSVGLWIGAVWGPVVWALAVAVDAVTYFGGVFDSIVRLLLNAILFVGFLVLILVEWRRSLD